jgi:hypothetical protein
MSAPDRLDHRQLNRATLQRQLLLERHRLEPVDAVEAVGGLNAQQANDPYLALQARLESFALDDLTVAVQTGELERACLHRGTQHLVTPGDRHRLRPLLGPLLARMQRNTFGARTRGVDPGELAERGRAILGDATMARTELGRLLARTWPDHEATALAWSAQLLLPLIHPAPTGTWDHRGRVLVRLADDDPTTEADAGWLVRRHLTCFGPATPADIRAWTGVAGMAEVVEAMGEELRPYVGPDGRQLVDLADGPGIPDRDCAAPPRLLGQFDELLLAFADRSRVMTDDVRRRVCIGDLIDATLLVDGAIAGTWQLDRPSGSITLRPFGPVAAADLEALTSEAHAILVLTAPDVPDRHVRLASE